MRFDDLVDLLKEHGVLEVVSLLRYIDIENIRQLWMERTLLQKGNLDANELQEALLVQAGLPDYVFRFLDQFDTPQDRLKHFSSLVAAFFQEEIPKQTGFLKDWLILERNMRLVLIALRAKKMGRPLLEEMQHEDAHDPLVAEILAQKDAAAYSFGEIGAIYEEHQDDPLKLHQALLEYRFNKAQEMINLQVFTIDKILSYLVQLFLVEKWNKLNEKEGQKIMNTILGAA